MSNVNIRLQSTEKKFMFENQILSKGLVLLIQVTLQWKKSIPIHNDTL